MLLDFTKVDSIFIVTGKTDLHKGIDGLARIIQQEYEMDVYEEALSSCGTLRDRFKMIYWQKDGFLLYKRIETVGFNGLGKKKRSDNCRCNRFIGSYGLEYLSTQSDKAWDKRIILTRENL